MNTSDRLALRNHPFLSCLLASTHRHCVLIMSTWTPIRSFYSQKLVSNRLHNQLKIRFCEHFKAESARQISELELRDCGSH